MYLVITYKKIIVFSEKNLMFRIGLLSDTHSYLPDGIFDFFTSCDEIWHAGDWGNLDIYTKLSAYKPVRGVWGNIDGQEIRALFPKISRFKVEEVDVMLTHIGGYPNKYDTSIKHEVILNPPRLFICGHSHILKVMYDKKLNMLHINPGAAGKYGFHTISTAVRFEINKDRIENLEVLEIEK